MHITTVGIDLAKSVFLVHGVDERGKVVLRKQLKRAQFALFFSNLPPCLIGMEACGSAHHWARKLQGLGHTVKLIAPQLVKPYVKRGKNDAADAEALCEAMSRPTMRFVPVKTAEQQAASVLVGRQAHLDALAFRFGAGASVAEREQKLAGLRATARDSWFATPVLRDNLGERERRSG